MGWSNDWKTVECSVIYKGVVLMRNGVLKERYRVCVGHIKIYAENARSCALQCDKQLILLGKKPRYILKQK